MSQINSGYEPISKIPSQKTLDKLTSSYKTIPELVKTFRSFFREYHQILFEMMVKYSWLSHSLLYNGARRAFPSGNGYMADWIFSYFFKTMVGISQKPVTSGFIFYTIPSYFEDFFPKFFDYNPFEEPEYFRYPYKHITLDFLIVVYQCDDRLEMLAEAEKRQMSIMEFSNWAIGRSLPRLNSKGESMYVLNSYNFIPYLSRCDIDFRNRKNKSCKKKRRKKG